MNLNIKMKWLLAPLFLTGIAFAQGLGSFDGDKKTLPAISIAANQKNTLTSYRAIPPDPKNIDIEITQLSQNPDIWTIRYGAATVTIQRIPWGLNAHKVIGPGIDLEIGKQPSSFPSHYIRGNGGIITSDPILMQVLWPLLFNRTS